MFRFWSSGIPLGCFNIRCRLFFKEIVRLCWNCVNEARSCCKRQKCQWVREESTKAQFRLVNDAHDPDCAGTDYFASFEVIFLSKVVLMKHLIRLHRRRIDIDESFVCSLWIIFQKLPVWLMNLLHFCLLQLLDCDD